MMFVGTGNEELDRRLGGIIHPSIISVEGEPGTGKTIIACQFTDGFLNAGKRVVYISSELLTLDLVNKMRAIKINVLSFLGRSLRILPINVRRFVWNSSEINRLLSMLSAYMMSIQDADLIVVDNLSTLSNLTTKLEALDFLRKCRLLSKRGTTLIFTIHPSTMPEILLTEMKSMIDVSFKLSSFSLAGRRLRSLERMKGIGSQGGSDTVSFDIDPSLGIKIVPMSVSKS